MAIAIPGVENVGKCCTTNPSHKIAKRTDTGIAAMSTNIVTVECFI